MRNLAVLTIAFLMAGCGTPPLPAATRVSGPESAAASPQRAISPQATQQQEAEVLLSVARYVGERLTARRRGFDPSALSSHFRDSSLVQALAHHLGASVRALDEAQVCGEWICRLESTDVLLMIHRPTIHGDTAQVTVTTYSNSTTLRPGLEGQLMRAERDVTYTLAPAGQSWQVVSSQLTRIGH